MQTCLKRFESLKKAFKIHKTPAQEYSDKLLPQVVKYVWSTEPQYYMEQLFLERGNRSKGRILKTEPEELYRCHKTGYDKDGNVITEEYWGGHPSNGYTKFFVTEGNHIYSYNIDRGGAFDEIEYLEYTEGKPSVYASVSRYKSALAENYFYDTDGRLNCIECEVDHGGYVQETKYDVYYDSFGALLKITRTDGVSPTFPQGQTGAVVYQKTGYSIKALTEIFVEEMVKALTEPIKASQHKYAMIALDAAFSSDDWLPLRLRTFDSVQEITTELLLSDFVNEDPVNYTPIDISENLREVSQLLIQQATVQEKYDLPYKLLITVAKTIKQRVGDDTIIIPADLYDDYSESVVQIFKRLYNAKDLKKIQGL
nr:hypothetical protein [uncultured Flavobacterium sp.]